MDHQIPSTESQSAIATTLDDAVVSKTADPSGMTRTISTSSLTSLNLDKPYSVTRRRRSFSDGRSTKKAVVPSPTFVQSLPPRNQRRRRLRRSRWLIPADHPMKTTWDVLTILLSLVFIYATHASIRDRSFGQSYFGSFCDVWFLIDILLNFVTEYRTDEGLVLRQGKAVWARYLTTWFVVDALSLVPWESLYIKPIIEMQNRRHFFKKSFFRTRAVIRVTRLLRGRHLKLFGRVAKHTKHAGVGANRLLRLLIKYVPKYLLFYRNMRGVLAVRMLRQVHWVRKIKKKWHVKQDDATDSLTYEDADDDYSDDDYYFSDDVDDDMDVVHIQYDEQDLDIGLYG